MPISKRDYKSGALLFTQTGDEKERLNLKKRNIELEKIVKSLEIRVNQSMKDVHKLIDKLENKIKKEGGK